MISKQEVRKTFRYTDFELLFSDEYINNVTERLSLYNELASVKNERKFKLFRKKLIDRFGLYHELMNIPYKMDCQSFGNRD
jgi:transcription-repair coupling factor (superfamily II helicase)